MSREGYGAQETVCKSRDQVGGWSKGQRGRRDLVVARRLFACRAVPASPPVSPNGLSGYRDGPGGATVG